MRRDNELRRTKRKRKAKRGKLPAPKSYRPDKAPETEFIRVLDGWHAVTIDDPFGNGGPIECIISPDKKTYRRSHSWEAPTIVIDANILPPEHHIRLTRVTNKSLRKLAKRMLRQRLRAHRNRA